MSNWNRQWLVAVGALLILVAGAIFAGTMQGQGVGGTSGGPLVDTTSGREAAGEVAGARSDQPAATSEPSTVLSLPSTPVIQWGELAFSAKGFQPGETVTLLVEQEGEMKEVGQVEAGGEGRIQDAKLLLPGWLESGSRAARVVGETSGTEASGTLLVRAKNLWVNLESHTLRQAAKLGFVAGGFEPGDLVKVYLTQGGDSSSLGSQEPLASMTADQVGNGTWTEAEVPLVQPGEYTLLLKGESTAEELRAEVTVEPLAPDLELSPWSGLPGRKVRLNANGFLPDEEVDVFVGAAGEPAATFRSDRYGGVWGAGPISIPVDSREGSLSVTMRGRSSGGEVERSFSVVASHPWAELGSYSGFSGTPVMVHGGGFAAGERISLHIGSASSPPVASVVANDEGYYQGLGPARVPDDATMQAVFVVVGESSGAQATATFEVIEPFMPELPRLEPRRP